MNKSMSTLTPTRVLPPSNTSADKLPEYAGELAAFHRAFAAELRAAVGSLPVKPWMRILDVCCGDGFYMELFADRLKRPGGVTGLDVNAACVNAARRRLAV